ncbi:MAG: SEC-C metal-binding domain-containing protein [Thiohalomonadales bacterium]
MSNHIEDDLSQLDFESLIEDSIDHILEHGDAQVYLQWLQQSIIEYQHDFQTDLSHDRRMQIMLASVIGRMIWNATPLPDNDFQPLPLPKPQRNSLCICGSGKKYKHCCVGMPPMPPISKNEIWPIVLGLLNPLKLEQALSSGNVPLESLFMAAEDFMETGNNRKALELLEPKLENVKKYNSREHEHALNLVCNLYDELGYSTKKQKLLDHVITSAGRSALRSGAYQRLSTIAMDSGDSSLAWQHFNQALQDDPDEISLSLLEVQLLLADNNFSQAKQRAQFWLKKFQKLGFPEDEYPMEFLINASKDPSKAFLDLSMNISDGTGEDLVPLINNIKDRPCPLYTIGKFDEQSFNEDEDDLFALSLEPAPSMQSLENAIELVPSDSIQKIEQIWKNLFYFDKPFSIQDEPLGEHDPWEMEQEWLDFLETHPAAFDSIEILDDIATALVLHEMSNQPWHDEHLLKPILFRVADIINMNLQNVKEPHLSWMIQDNRPALRSMARLIGYHLRNNNSEDGFQLMKRIIQLNPNDNHGFRSLLANEYLIRGENDNCLKLAACYPDDINPEIEFGKVLALYRFGKLADAKNALCTAIISFPKVIPALIAKKVKKPKIDDAMVTYGGDDQAWFYRLDMQQEWLSTDGAFEWLKKTSTQCNELEK